MSKQIFKSPVPNTLIFNLLDSICQKNNKYYLLTSESFKKGMFNGSIPKFIEDCKEYYHLSKQKYLEKKICYNTFNTVLRQICNYNKIIYTNKIKYNNSNYQIIYYIYFQSY